MQYFTNRLPLRAAIAAAALSLQASASQDVISYIPPLKGDLSLSGNFGELRPNHLHSGVDFRVGGVEGKPVYAVAQGYVSRIVVRPNGYGNALYVAHPNGATSVYGHLQQFAPAIAAWVREKQYAAESFFLDVSLDSLAFPLHQGEQIGLAGNSGSSSGPHLHFEIRNRRQEPLNIMQDGVYRMSDSRPPLIRQLLVYTFDTVQGLPIPEKYRTLGVRQAGGAASLAGSDTIAVDGACYFGIDMQDRMDNSERTFGVTGCTIRLNDTVIFAYNMSRFNFNETRYCNAMLDFAESQRSGAKIVRLYVAQGNRLSIYRQVRSQGIARLKPREKAKICITLTDDAGNSTELPFWVKRAEKAAKKQAAGAPQQALLWFKSNTCESGGFRVTIPTGTLYESSFFELQTSPPDRGSASPVYYVKQPATPPHRAVSVGVRTSIPERLWSKAVVVRMDDNGRKNALPTTFKMPYFTASSRSWGRFFVEVDTVPPQITPVNFVDGGRLGSAQQRITLRVKDNLGEIKSYAGHVDERWALFEYDEKNDLMHYYIDPERVQTGVQHTIWFTASDVAGNIHTFTCELHF